MSGQLTRIYNLTLTQANQLIVTPEFDEFVQIVRLEDGAEGAGYYGKRADGTYEYIGGTGSAPYVQLFTHITQGAVSQSSQQLIANPSGGVAPYSYEWFLKSRSSIEPSIVVPNTNTSSITITNLTAGDQVGLVELQVTDSLGRKSSASYWVELTVEL